MTAPGPGRLEALRIARRFRAGSLEDLDALRHDYGDFVHLPAPIDAYVAFSPELIETVLATRQRAYRKSNNYREMRRVMGMGLVTSDGESWATQRRQVGAGFRSAEVESRLGRFTASARSWVGKWKSRDGSVYFDPSEDLARLSAELTNDLLFGRQDHVADLQPWIQRAAGAVVERIYAPIRLPLWAPTPRNRRERTAVHAIDEALGRVLQEDLPPDCIASMLRNEAGLGDTALRDQLVTLMLAGQDTLSAALGWFFHCMATHPEAQARVREELEREIGDEPPTARALCALRHTRAALLESMRLYPPIPIIARTPIAEETLAGTKLDSKSVVLCAIASMHRHPEWWQDPGEFRPERFLEDESPRAFHPFALGPRKCLGDRLAMAQAMCVVAATLPQVQLESMPGFVPTPRTTITMSSGNGFRFRTSAFAKAA